MLRCEQRTSNRRSQLRLTRSFSSLSLVSKYALSRRPALLRITNEPYPCRTLPQPADLFEPLKRATPPYTTENWITEGGADHANFFITEIKSEADLIGPGAKPGTVATDLEQATGLERMEILGRMQGIDIFNMEPLDASRPGPCRPCCPEILPVARKSHKAVCTCFNEQE